MGDILITDFDPTEFDEFNKLELSQLQNLTFSIQGFEQPVSIFHRLLVTGQTKLFQYLVDRYQLSDLKSDQLAGPPLIIIAIQLYLDPDNFGRFYQINHDAILSDSKESQLLFIKSLLKLGWTMMPVNYRLIEMCLEVDLGNNQSATIQDRLLQLYELLYQFGFQIGLRRLFKNSRLIGLIRQAMPKIYAYMREHYSATVIQALYRGHLCRRKLFAKSFT